MDNREYELAHCFAMENIIDDECSRRKITKLPEIEYESRHLNAGKRIIIKAIAMTLVAVSIGFAIFDKHGISMRYYNFLERSEITRL